MFMIIALNDLKFSKILALQSLFKYIEYLLNVYNRCFNFINLHYSINYDI